MGKRSVVLGAAVALVALAVGAIGPAWGAASDKDKQRTFTPQALTIERAFEGTALGDQIVFTSQLLKGDTGPLLGRGEDGEGIEDNRFSPTDTRGA